MTETFWTALGSIVGVVIGSAAVLLIWKVILWAVS